MQAVADAFTEAGIPPTTVHFIAGAGGVEFLDRLGNWFTRTLSKGLTLESGATMVGVFEVADPDAEAIRSSLSDAGVGSQQYFGSWTYT